MTKPIEPILEAAINQEASDIHLTVGRPITLRLSGELVSQDETNLTPQDTEALASEITTEEQRKVVQEVGGLDFGFAYKDKARFRVSLFKQQGHLGMVLRQLPNKFRTFEDIGLPEQIRDVLNRPRGLVLVTGPTGSGKTTTLAAMINYINDKYAKHIITAEDPIEFVYPMHKSVINQREVGSDVPSFALAVEKALRQDPDVILIGEMRGLETMQNAIRAAETGHLVFSTLHTTGAARTVDRIIDVFPPEQQSQIRVQLSSVIVAVISQALIPRIDKPGRIAAHDVLIATPAIRNLIREGKTYQVNSELQTGKKYGMKYLDDVLKQYYADGIISYESALEFAQEPRDLAGQLAQIVPKKKDAAAPGTAKP